MCRKLKIKKQSRRDPEAAVRKSGNSGKRKFNKKDVLYFQKLILKMKEEILDGIKHISEDILKKSQKDAAGDISGYTYHMADVATDTYDREFSLGLASNDRKMMYELEDALKRIEEGTFGTCEDCKNTISKSRLKAVPYARLCVKCQEKKEKS
ncbi:MAG: TraR/DksA family transcriptional regulator [Candidatus Omnitrophota bacterium]|nr:MAG: TraR/DksA family transcriptional regulator [Candidatus Omnitrophota bacterium]